MERNYLLFIHQREKTLKQKISTNKITKIVSGYSTHCTFIGKLIYSKIVNEIYTTPNIKTAEMAKLLENIRAINISLINELKILSKNLDIDIEVIKAAKTKPFGFEAFYPVLGLAVIAYQLIRFIFHGWQK